MHQREDLERFHMASLCLPLYRSFIVCAVSRAVKSICARSSGPARRRPSSWLAPDDLLDHLIDGVLLLPREAGDAPPDFLADPRQERGRRDVRRELGAVREQPSQIPVVEVRELHAIPGPLALVVRAQRPADARERIHGVARGEDGIARADVAHQVVHVLQLPQRRPACVPSAPLGVGRQPHREGLGEVFRRVALGVPGLQMHHEAPAVGPRRVVLGVRFGRAAEQLLAPPAPMQAIRIVDGVAGLVAQDPEAPLRRAALDLEHLAFFELGQPRMGEIERQRDP